MSEQKLPPSQRWCPHSTHPVVNGYCETCLTAEREFAITLPCPYKSPASDPAFCPSCAALQERITELIQGQAALMGALDLSVGDTEDLQQERNYLRDVIVKQVGRIDEFRAAKETAEARVQELERKMTWQPISTARKDGTVIVAWGRGDGPGSQSWIEKVCYWKAECEESLSCWTFDADGCKAEPEGWMPLPSAPTAVPWTEEGR